MKITVIGGGSLLWGFGFVRQFAKSEFLAGSNVCLMDIDPEALSLVGAAASRYVDSCSNPIVLQKTDKLDEAMDGADFVVISISTGGLDAMRHDLEIPEKYGIYHTVGDTVGPGGWLRAVRNIPVFSDFGSRMKKLCPDAWLINVSNPLTPLTRTPQREFGIKTIGMCPGVENAARSLARLAGADPTTPVDYVVTGIDHGSWFTQIKAGPMDVLAKLEEMGFKRSDDNLPAEVSADDPLAERVLFRAAFAVWKEIGYLPSISDRHIVENFPWFLMGDPNNLGFGIKRTSVEERQAWRDERQALLETYVKTGDEDAVGTLGHGDDPIVTVIESLLGQRSFLYGSNYMNVGQTPELPLGAVVETRCRFDSAGVHPLSSPMPAVVQMLTTSHAMRQEAIIDIALHGTFDELSALVMTDPLCSRLKMGECRSMVREMLQANHELIQNPRLLE